MHEGISRRNFGGALGLAAAALAVGPASTLRAADDPPIRSRRLKLGLDNFAVRAMGWKAPELIRYTADLELDSLFISDLDALGSLADGALREIRTMADDHGLDLHVGTWSICPTSTSFRDTWGTAEEHLRTGIRVAKALGSPVIRVVLGSGRDRSTEGGIQARIDDTVAVLKKCRNQAMDSGIRIAMENHAGDMQAREVVSLIEAAGPEFVGANMDSGNAVWTMEDPVQNLEVLGPHALTTSLRDSAVWESERGATVQWTAMGDGNTDLKTYFERFAAICPDVPVHIETISGFNREIPYLERDFWDVWPDARASDLARFIALAKSGQPRAPWSPPVGTDRQEANRTHQKSEIERSIRFCKNELGLGRRR